MFPFLISILSLLFFLLFDHCQPIPMLKSPEEQQEKTPQFWSFFLQPGRFETTRPELAENLEAGQQNIQQGGKQKQLEEMNTSELGRREEPDYYDAVKAEEEEMERQKQQQNNGGGGKESAANSTTETAGILNMMTALQVNVDPSPMLLIDGSAEGGKGGGEKPQKKMKPIVFPAKGRDQKKEAEKITTMDGDTYDDERAEMGKADEEEGKAEGNGTSKMGEQQPADIVLLPEGRESLAREMVGRKEAIDGQTSGGSGENEEEEGGEWPVVDGQTGDGKGAKGQEGLAQPPRAKIFGKFA